jgi:hypothetical protein
VENREIINAQVDLPAHIIDGFNRLGRSSFLQELRRFADIHRAAKFAIDYHDQAMRNGWREIELYGLHPTAPGPRIQYRGFAFLIGPEDEVTEITPKSIAFRRRASIQRFYRWPDAGDAVLAWNMI